ncbi:MAG: HAD-IA family hydrolase [Propionicimonas sp.]|uniref:HAD-IA family hydrolase n=1 Tax=Propionicimonas sp. TaxID=1955623 RepID=UPI002B21EDBA|nr:HAD-IA family hydrolase [Propionicimonas sp.]MEA4945430.1 HAD-IA family hydrolase [Propionicimonas sp.]
MPALIFDCDGVLADTERDGHLPAFNAAFAEAGLPITWSEADYAEKVKIGGGKERIASVFTPDLDARIGATTAEQRADWIKQLHLRKTALFTQRVADGLLPGRPGIHRIIADALAAGWTVAVASTSAEASVRAVLRHAAGDASYAQVHVFAGDVVKAKKPAPDIYLKVLEDLQLDPAECVVVEDSGIGVAAARAAGLTTVVTVSAFTAEDDFTGAALVLSDLGAPGAPPTVIASPDGIEPEDCLTLTDLTALIAKEHTT